jgi:hypothetical protein
MELILIAFLVSSALYGYVWVAPDETTLAVSRGAVGAIQEGWVSGAARYRERRAAKEAGPVAEAGPASAPSAKTAPKKRAKPEAKGAKPRAKKAAAKPPPKPVDPTWRTRAASIWLRAGQTWTFLALVSVVSVAVVSGAARGFDAAARTALAARKADPADYWWRQHSVTEPEPPPVRLIHPTPSTPTTKEPTVTVTTANISTAGEYRSPSALITDVEEARVLVGTAAAALAALFEHGAAMAAQYEAAEFSSDGLNVSMSSLKDSLGTAEEVEEIRVGLLEALTPVEEAATALLGVGEHASSLGAEGDVESFKAS